MKKRIESLDWLRGLMALSIMLFHMVSWHFTVLDSSSLLGRLGIYGVSIFFVLSGLSMAIVYKSFIKDFHSSIQFFIRRIFRIWPLLWLCVFLIIIPRYITSGEFDYLKVISNLTTAFGFIDPSGYINTGAWSIGNEMVYYALTPIVIIAFNKRKSLGNIITFLSFVIFCMFALKFLNGNNGLEDQWNIYINPFNNLFLYLSGIAIYYNLDKIEINSILIYGMVIISVCLLAFYPASGNRINIVIGPCRFIFVLACILLVIGFYKFKQYELIPRYVNFALAKLGVATYGVYLFHPIVDMYLAKILDETITLYPIICSLGTILITLLVALFSYYSFENKLIRLGKNITDLPSKSNAEKISL